MAEQSGNVNDLEIRQTTDESRSNHTESEPIESRPGERNDPALNSLVKGIEKNYLTEQEKARLKVKELIHNQDVLRESIQQEMTNLSEYRLTEDITEFVNELKSYHLKLRGVKKDIQYISDKVAKMKRQSFKLKANKEKEERQIEHNKRKEQEFQKHLTAKPAAAAAEIAN